jgi:pimeloyl-ACP methyl ester carboxylesterase
MISIAGIELEILERGQGEPVLFLHGTQNALPDDHFLAALARERRVIAPSHPGFGKSTLPDWLDSVDDIAHVYLELMDKLGIAKADVVGCSLGGWIAADIATKAPDLVRRLVLVSPVGVKVGPSDKLDIPDVFATSQDKLNRLLFHNPEKSIPNFSTLPEERLTVFARNRETLALLVWEPYMHNPKLRHRLHRAAMPALFLRGASDGIVSADYLKKYAALLPNAQTGEIAEAGHLAQFEQPDALAARVLTFLKS